MHTDTIIGSSQRYQGNCLRRAVYSGFGTVRSHIRKPLASAITVSLLTFPMGALAAESMDVKQEMTFSAQAASDVAWSSPIMTHNGSIYYTWLDNQDRTMIAKKAPDGKITTNVIVAKTGIDKNHRLASLGVDKNGYIHVVYDMHGDPWKYQVSDKPEDISSFTSQANTARAIPMGAQKTVTYPHFWKDNFGVLYVTFRAGAGPFHDHGQSAAIAKYDADAERWTMLGGTDYKFSKSKVFFWSDSGGHDTGSYQSYRARLYFDTDNRMHVSWSAFILGSHEKDESHIFYAYSDDGGQTFKKADGTTIKSLPITPANADVVAVSNPPIFGNMTSVGTQSNGKPIVFFHQQRGEDFYSKWTGSSWSPRQTYPGDRARVVVDSNGVVTAIDLNKNRDGLFNRSSDGGQTWKSFQMATGAAETLDYVHFKETGDLRFQAIDGSTARVSTARFVGENEPSIPAAPTGLTITSGQRR